MNKIVKITVTATTPDNFLHELDANVAGEYSIEVLAGQTPEQENCQALDRFHETVPIKVLDDFLIEVKQPDWLDDHIEIIGVSDEVADKIKDRLREDLGG